MSIKHIFIVIILSFYTSVQAQTIEKQITIQNNNYYKPVTCDSSESIMKLNVDVKNETANGIILRFNSLDELIRGDRIEIIDATLSLYYKDEYWSKLIYHVAASRSLDGTVENLESNPESIVKIYGDKWPKDKKTSRPSWINLPISKETIKLWLDNKSSNKGLVVNIPKINSGSDQELINLKYDKQTVGSLFVGFRSCNNPGDSFTPKLTVRYKIYGNAPPATPKIDKFSNVKRIYNEVVISWAPVKDPNIGDLVHYDFQAGYGKESDIKWTNATVQLNGSTAKWLAEQDQDRFYNKQQENTLDKKLWYRVRAVDSHGDSSGWAESGPYIISDQVWTVWGTHGNNKIWQDNEHSELTGSKIKIKAARNEWESFQVGILGHNKITGISVSTSELDDAHGNKVPAPTIYHQHYLPVTNTPNKEYGHIGLVPDALVPLYHPETKKKTGGKYGGNVFNTQVGEIQAFWFDLYIDETIPAGIYRGMVKVNANEISEKLLPIELEVFDFELSSPKHLIATFQLSSDSVKKSHMSHDRSKLNKLELSQLSHKYESMLHGHYINNWSPITGFNYGLNGVDVKIIDNKVIVDWTKYDELITPYMDGSAYDDGTPAQTLFIPYWIPVKKAKGDGWARRVNIHNYKNIDLDLFAQYIEEVQRHMREKGWLDRAYVFYFDEPFISEWKYTAFIQIGKIIRKYAPELKILITDGYKGTDGYKNKSYISESIENYVDVWDPVTFQVSNIELANYYRNRKAQGKLDMWCQTLANANPNRAVINLFPEFDMPFHRMWGVMSWNFGFQGIEWWETIVWWDNETKQKIDPWTNPKAFPGFRRPINSDGRLFFPGTPDAIGGPDIPISTIRMKAVREAIEDYEYLYLLDQLGGLKDFSIDVLHTTDQSKADTMKMPMPMGKGPWQWWEGDPDVMMQQREKLARLIEKYSKHH